MRFISERLSSLVKTLELTGLDELSALSSVAEFATIISTYTSGISFTYSSCLDPSFAIKPVFSRFDIVIITSGTLSPLDMYPKMLDFIPAIKKSFPMTLSRASFSPLIVTRGSDQVPISSKFDVRNDPSVVRNFGLLLIELSKTVPDGIVCFFPSYIYMEGIITLWNEMAGVIENVLANKLVFVETPDFLETSLALSNYRKACCNGRGAVLFSVARGKVSEGIDFDHHYGRAVIMFGIPYQNTESRVLRCRLEYLREKYSIKENDFLSFDAIRHASQCVGRVLRGKSDYGLMIFADKRYIRADKRSKLPKWINQAIMESNSNLSVDMAINIARRFFRKMAQPFNPSEHVGVSLWNLDQLKIKEEQRRNGFDLFAE